MAAQGLLGKLEDMVECPVCLERFSEPRLLPCQHSFCTECLYTLLGTARTLRCPCCNKEAPVPNGVRDLPVDFKTNTLLETIRQAVLEEAGLLGADAAPLKACDTSQDAALCPVCTQTPAETKNLSCGHGLCSSCVQFLQLVTGDTFHCPTCSEQITLLPTASTTPLSAASSGDEHPEAGSSWEQTYSVVSPVRQPEHPPEENLLTFHSICGKKAVIHPNQRTAHRKDPLSTYCDAIVLTSRYLEPNELFGVRLDKMADKWSGTIQIGVTTHSPTCPALPREISHLGSGTWYLFGGEVRHKENNVWTTIKQYQRNLEELKVGDRVAVQRRKHGDLHFYINGVDLGAAVSDVPEEVYGVIELYGKVEQVTVIDSAVALQTSSHIAQPVNKISLMDRLRKKMTFMKTTEQ